jgi:hypothetical protein
VGARAVVLSDGSDFRSLDGGCPNVDKTSHNRATRGTREAGDFGNTLIEKSLN